MKIWLIIFLVLMVSHRVQSQIEKRPVVNITCLELAAPSNQQLRLSCSDPSDYHCLLDESYTQEYEACREWKWIPEGKCAYFNTYGRGNIDERNCVPKPNLTCSHGTVQFLSATNTKYTACYVKKEISTLLPVTTSQFWTQSDGGNATSVSTTSDKQDERTGHVLLIILLGSIVPTASIAVIYLIFMHLKYVPSYRKAYPIESQESSDKVRNEDSLEQQPFLKNEVEDNPKSPPTMMHENENITEARRNDESIVEKQPVLGIKVEGTSTSESPPTMRQDDGNIAEARRSGNSDASNPADMNESDFSEKFEDAPSSPTIIKQKNAEESREKHQKGDSDGLRTTEVDSNTCKSAEVDISKDLKEGVSTADVQRKKLDEEKSAENATGLYIVSEKSDNEGDTQELTDVFDDTVESLQRIAHPTDEQDRELCTELYNLLDTEGLKLTQEVMAATITRETGKPVKILLNNLTVQEKNKLKAMLPEESHRILESETEHDNSIHVSYGLHRIILNEEKSPKSGWGNPVRETDTGIGDDVDRLYRIQNIVQGIPNPVTVSVESYIRLLDIMIEALTRLDPDAEFKEDYKLLCCKLESIKNPNLTQTMLKTIKNIVKKIW
ncbi:uncharacterized protein LOC128189352 [Crassostrea angulata]|uniref:uncharacterized protein LOC128189352 n=1 Tax=Magallana angulata TaxID=2784310 RepID=UPI0022B09762|nr:uncharacterized protein LOC128189352 [Crassostrea angulata]